MKSPGSGREEDDCMQKYSARNGARVEGQLMTMKKRHRARGNLTVCISKELGFRGGKEVRTFEK